MKAAALAAVSGGPASQQPAERRRPRIGGAGVPVAGGGRAVAQDARAGTYMVRLTVMDCHATSVQILEDI